MERGVIAACLLVSLALMANQSAYAKKFQLNKSVGSPEITFLSKAPLEDIKGTVQPDKINSTIYLDINKPENSSGFINLQVTGMETGIKRRDGHLQSPNWLDAAKYPEIKFDLNKISGSNSSNNDQSNAKIVLKATVEGVIFIHGKSKNISSPITITYLKESAATKQRATGDLFFVEGYFDVALRDFDVQGVQGLVGSKVGEIIKIEFKLYYNIIN